MWASTSELRPQTWTTVPFWYDILCILSSISRNPQGSFNSNTLQMTPLLSKMFIFILKVGRQLQPTSYDPVHTSLSRHFVCKYVWQQISYHLLLCYTQNDWFTDSDVFFIGMKQDTTYKLASTHALNCIPSQVNMGESDVEHRTENKQMKLVPLTNGNWEGLNTPRMLSTEPSWSFDIGKMNIVCLLFSFCA